MSVTLQTIQAARNRIRDRIYHSPCPYSLSLSRLCGAEVFCKLDHLQMTGSFKERGARNKLLLLTPDQRRAGVIAASAGNHALGLAYHGQDLGIPVTVVMPEFAPLVKLRTCRQLGADVRIIGQTFDESYAAAQQLASECRLSFIPGFDDPDIIAGQGTLGLEILEDVPDVDVVIVPVGGGGLISGVGTAIKSLRPQVRIIGVEPENAPTLKASLDAGRVMRIATRPTLADGLAVAQAGTLCFQIARTVIDDLLLVTEAQIAQAVLRLLELEKMVLEGAGAVPLAAAMNPQLDLGHRKIVLLLSGGNIDVTIIANVIERGLVSDGRLCRITAMLSERPGSLAHLLSVIAQTGASVQEVAHDRNFGPGDVGYAAVSCTVQTRDVDHIRQLTAALKASGIDFRIDPPAA